MCPRRREQETRYIFDALTARLAAQLRTAAAARRPAPAQLQTPNLKSSAQDLVPADSAEGNQQSPPSRDKVAQRIENVPEQQQQQQQPQPQQQQQPHKPGQQSSSAQCRAAADSDAAEECASDGSCILEEPVFFFSPNDEAGAAGAEVDECRREQHDSNDDRTPFFGLNFEDGSCRDSGDRAGADTAGHELDDQGHGAALKRTRCRPHNSSQLRVCLHWRPWLA